MWRQPENNVDEQENIDKSRESSSRSDKWLEGECWPGIPQGRVFIAKGRPNPRPPNAQRRRWFMALTLLIGVMLMVSVLIGIMNHLLIH